MPLIPRPRMRWSGAEVSEVTSKRLRRGQGQRRSRLIERLSSCVSALICGPESVSVDNRMHRMCAGAHSTAVKLLIATVSNTGPATMSKRTGPQQDQRRRQAMAEQAFCFVLGGVLPLAGVLWLFCH